MTDQWDQFAKSASRTVDDLGYEDNVNVFFPSETYSPGDLDRSYPNTPSMTFSAIVTTPEETSDTDRGGRRIDADIVLYFDDSSLPVVDREGRALPRVEIDGVRGTYEVRTVAEQQDGLARIECVEV